LNPGSRRQVIGGIAATALAPALAGFGSIETLFAPAKDLWERWTRHDPASTVTIDHSTWDDVLLARYLSADAVGNNLLAYGDVTPADRRRLDAYIARLSAVSISGCGRPEQLAFWINLYNARTVALVLEHYPVESIRDIDISPGFFARGPWDKKLVAVEGESLTLNDIEHRILRPIWNDPRLHYAVNCASMGCPNLQSAAFAAANTDRLMEQGARAFVNSVKGVQFAAGRLVVSSIYAWFPEDFGDEDGVLAHLRRYAEPPLAGRLAGADRIDGDAYDWRLNDTARRS
jgi:hypothetical protein